MYARIKAQLVGVGANYQCPITRRCNLATSSYNAESRIRRMGVRVETHRGTMVDRDEEITQILQDLDGEVEVPTIEQLLPAVYDQLRGLAGAYLRAERSDHTLQATALVHEAYLRLTSGKEIEWKDRAHFFHVASRTIRRILVNHALARRADKRGGSWQKIPLDEITSELPVGPFDLVDVDELLRDLEQIDPGKARIVELRFFAGRTIAETATLLDISEATVERAWRFSRAWLRARLGEA